MMNGMEEFESAENLLRNSPICIHFINADGNIVWANQKELDSMGFSQEEFFNHSIVKFHYDQHVISDILNKAADFNGVENYPVRLVHKNKEIIYALITSNAYKENGEFKHTRSFTNMVPKEVYDIFKDKQKNRAK